MFPRTLTTLATTTSSRSNNVALEEFLPKCSICFTTFSSTTPRDDYAPIQSSKCSHTFCRSCILGSHRVQRHRSHRLACLVCRADGAFYMTNLHVNLELVRVMDAFAAVPMPVAVPRPLVTMAKATLADMVKGVTMNNTKEHFILLQNMAISLRLFNVKSKSLLTTQVFNVIFPGDSRHYCCWKESILVLFHP